MRAKILEDGGPRLWAEFMKELRHLHLGAPAPRRSVFARLQSAYEAALAEPRDRANRRSLASLQLLDGFRVFTAADRRRQRSTSQSNASSRVSNTFIG